MQFDVACTLSYAVSQPVTALFNIRPAATAQQRILHETLLLTPAIEVESMTIAPNGNRLDRILLGAGTVRLDYRARVELDVHRFDPDSVAECPPAALPMDILDDLMASRYCEADRFANLAHKLFAGIPPGHTRVTAICNWINENLDYRPGSSDAHTSAIDTLTDRAGVCRDFAHVGISLCRALGIPARFASSYAFGLDPPDFHAVFEAWLGDRWYLFDPTRQAALDGLVRIGVGRDAAEVAFANFWGGPVEPLDMQVSMVRSDGGVEDATRTTDAVSVAAA
jgi:transglutaminase-like putative cysteine protease